MVWSGSGATSASGPFTCSALTPCWSLREIACAWLLAALISTMLPATVPHMFTGLRIGVGMSWLAIVAAEMVQGGTGIGFFIWDSYNSSLLTDTIVALVWIGLIGFTLDRIVGWIGRRVARQA